MKHMTGNQWRLLSIALVLILFLTACAPAAAPAETGGAAEAEEAAPPAAVVEAPGTVQDGMMRPSGEPQRGGILRTAFGEDFFCINDQYVTLMAGWA